MFPHRGFFLSWNSPVSDPDPFCSALVIQMWMWYYMQNKFVGSPSQITGKILLEIFNKINLEYKSIRLIFVETK